MSLALIFSTALVIGFSGAMMPGPLLTVTIGETARRGFKAGPLVVLGHAMLEFLLVISLVAGLSAFLTRPSVSHTIAILGSIFLVYMGYTMARDALTKRVSLQLSPLAAEESRSGVRRQLNPVWSGVLTSLANPYWSLWWATVGLGYVTLALGSGYAGLIAFYAGHISADVIWYTAVAAAVAGGRRFLNDAIYQGILAICGLFLLGLACYFVYGVFV